MKSRSATPPGGGASSVSLNGSRPHKKSYYFPPAFIRLLIIENEAKTTEDKKQKKGPFVHAAPFLCSQRLRWPLSGVRWVSAANITQALCTGGDSFSARLCSILRPRPKSHACSSTSDCAANIPLSFRCTRALLSLSARLFSPPSSLSFSLLFSFFLSLFLPAEGLKAVKVAGWHSVTGAGGALGWPAGYQACKRWESQLPRPLSLPLPLLFLFLRFTPPAPILTSGKHFVHLLPSTPAFIPPLPPSLSNNRSRGLAK